MVYKSLKSTQTPPDDDVPLVKLVVRIPRTLQAELQAIRKQTGLSIAQQVRTSLTYWVARTRKSPTEAQTLISRIVARGVKGSIGPGTSGPAGPNLPGVPNLPPNPYHMTLAQALHILNHPEADPEPDPASQALWSAWKARQDAAGLKALAAGYFKDPSPDPEG